MDSTFEQKGSSSMDMKEMTMSYSLSQTKLQRKFVLLFND